MFTLSISNIHDVTVLENKYRYISCILEHNSLSNLKKIFMVSLYLYFTIFFSNFDPGHICVMDILRDCRDRYNNTTIILEFVGRNR